MKILSGSNDQRLVTIPRELSKALDLEPGEEVEWKVQDSQTLELHKK